MPIQSVVFPQAPVLIEQTYFKLPGQFNHTVPANAKFMRAHALGCGGQGDYWGGGACLARSTVVVTPGENIKIQVGNTSQANSNGDSWVKRNDNTVICYSDRGRGNGTRGLAANSQGDLLREGANGGTPNWGKPGSDNDDPFPVFGEGVGHSSSQAATAGGGGINIPQYDNEGNFLGAYYPHGAGMGRVCLQFFTAEPGLGL